MAHIFHVVRPSTEAMDMLCQAGEQPGLPAMVYDFVIRALLTDRLMEDAVSVHRM